MIAVFVFSACVPAFAQKTKPGRVLLLKSDFVQYRHVDASSDSNGVLLQWEMESESGNVGFYIYRFDEYGKQLVSQIMIPSSAVRASLEPSYGERYELFDPDGQIGSSYEILSLAIDGRRNTTGRIEVRFTDNLEAVSGHSAEYFKDRVKNKPGLDLQRNALLLDKDLQSRVNAAQSTPDLTTQRWVVSQPGAKIAVRKEGLYRVTRAELPSAIFDNSDPANWRLFLDGVEQAINIGGNGDYIEFYGRTADTVESDTRFYYLIKDNIAGKRMRSRVSRPISSPAIAMNYEQTFIKKERTGYDLKILNGDLENFFGRIITPVPVTFSFNLSGIDFTRDKFIFDIKLHGKFANPHVVGLTLNGNSIGSVAVYGQVPYTGSFELQTAYLVEGTNTLEMASLASAGDYSYFDSISVSFARKHVADQNKLIFYTQNYRGAKLDGFTSPNIRVFETTNDADLVQVTNLQIQQNGSQYSVNLLPHRGSVMYAVEDSAILQSPAVTVNNPSTLATTAHDANLVIISDAGFMTQAQAWASYRLAHEPTGFSVEVVDVADIFDEFNFGVLSSASIRDFLGYAKDNWHTPPQYVLLLGDATFDPRNYQGAGYNDLVPTKMVDTIFMETASDEALADFDGDGLAEMAIGRIPARTPDVVTNALAKVTRFETPAMQSFDRGFLCAYDEPRGWDFAAMCQELRDQLPASMPATMVDRLAPNSQTTLINAITINPGKYIVNYSGHGSAGVWFGPSFFSNANVVCTPGPDCIANVDHESIFTLLTCLNGYFISSVDSLSETLLKAENRGAVAVWASTGETTPDVQRDMGVRFYNQLAAGSITRMGDLIRDAKLAIPYGRDVRLSWALIGDPMLKVR